MRLFLTGDLATLTGLVLSLTLLLLAPPTLGQSLEPRSYTNVPVGLNFAVMGGSRLEGDLAPTPSAPIQNAELTIDVLAMGYARTLEVAGNSAKLAVSAARTCYEGSATFLGEFTEGRRCEYLDPSIRFAYNFYGAPAKDLREFMSWKPGLVVGTSLQVYRAVRRLHVASTHQCGHQSLGDTARAGYVLPERPVAVGTRGFRADLRRQRRLFQ